MRKISEFELIRRQSNNVISSLDKQIMLVKDKIRKLKADGSIDPEEKKAKLKELQEELNKLEASKNKQLISKTERESGAFQKPFSEALREECETRDNGVDETIGKSFNEKPEPSRLNVSVYGNM